MSASSLQSFNPCTGEVIWTGQVSGPADLDRAVTTARQASKAWGCAPLDSRRKVAQAFAVLYI